MLTFYKSGLTLKPFAHFFELAFFEHLPFIFTGAKKVSKPRESGNDFKAMRKFTSPKSIKKRCVFDIGC